MKDETLCLVIRSPLLIFIETVSQREKEEQVVEVFSQRYYHCFQLAFFYRKVALK